MLQAALGIVVFLLAAWAVSENRRAVPWRVVGVGLLLQIALAWLLLKLDALSGALLSLNAIVLAIEAATVAGAGFVFGFLGGAEPAPFDVTAPGSMFVLAFRVLPQILVFSVLVAILWHWRVLPAVVRGMSWALRRTLGVGGAEATAGAASIFLGTIEAPLVIRAYLAQLSRGELFTVMTCGMATVAGSVMVLFASILGGVLENPLGQILTASVISVPGAILIARLMIPTDVATSVGDRPEGISYGSTLDAITRGTSDGMALVINVGAMLVVLVALVALVNGMLGALPEVAGSALSLERVFGWLLAPVAWLMGIPWSEAQDAGSLLGTKLILNELLAYLQYSAMGPDAFSPRSDVIITFALCGFANLGSVGIMLGGLSALCPQRRSDILVLAPRSLYSGTLVTCMTGAIVGLIY